MLRVPNTTIDPPRTVPWKCEPPRTLHGLLYHDTVEKAFNKDFSGGIERFSSSSQADLFEVTENGAVIRPKVDDDGIRGWLKVSQTGTPGDRSTPRLRIIFIDAVSEKPDVLPITDTLMRDIVANLDVNPRFVEFLTTQQMPGRQTMRHKSYARHEMWYSAIIRADERTDPSIVGHPDLSRSLSYWQRFCVWSDYQQHKDEDGHAHDVSTFMLWRCPVDIKDTFVRTFEGTRGLKLLDHPLSAHAFFLEHMTTLSYDFLSFFPNLLYWWENQASELHTPEDYTKRSQVFLTMSRQIQQVSTDHHILEASIVFLQAQLDWFSRHTTVGDTGLSTDSTMMEEILESMVKKVKLCGIYARLYLDRARIGVNEGLAAINQRDSELNLQIAQASHSDNRSLRTIQILSIVFLPGSFVSSIFGMGFFTTSRDGAGGTNTFAAAPLWWLYFAVSVPLTLVVVILMLYYQRRDRSKNAVALARGGSTANDLEALTWVKGRPEKGVEGPLQTLHWQ
ncbi:hypothetical protein GGR56DRAFT_152647 [Xylariaceae sp. FL0804]|nr:hypothetical protein GGR56DRAFT_152647 [Xylariaceae sp. FL0804]